jgi:hypothetical protein
MSIAGENYLSLVGQVLTANAVNVSGTNITGVLKATAFPAQTGDVTNTSGSLANTISNSAVTFAKFQNISTAVLLGRYTTGSGVMQQITLGSGLSLNTSTGVLTAAGGVSSVGLTMPTGFSVTGSPVTSSGTLAVTTTLNGIVNANGSAFSIVTISAPITYSSGFLGVDTSMGTNSVATWYQLTHNPTSIPLILKGAGLQHMYSSSGGDTLYQEALKNSTLFNFIKNSDSSISISTNIVFGGSLVLSGVNATLVNDNPTPGNNFFYGTGPTGTKGFFVYSSLPIATTSVAGLLSAADKRRIDSTIFVVNDRTISSSDSLGYYLYPNIQLRGLRIHSSDASVTIDESASTFHTIDINLTTSGGGGFTNPMTSVGDLILGGTAGAAGRLGIGSNGYALISNGTTASWQGTFYTSITSINDSSFTLNRPNGTKDTVQINVSSGGGTSNGVGRDSVQSYTSGSTLTQTSGYNYIQVNPSSVISALTITSATTFHTSNDLYIVFGGTITSENPVVTSFSFAAGSGLNLAQAINPNGVTYKSGEVIHYHKIGSLLYRIN